MLGPARVFESAKHIEADATPALHDRFAEYEEEENGRT